MSYQNVMRAAVLGGGILMLAGTRPAQAELGWREADYVKRFGAAMKSSFTPKDAQFVAPGGGGGRVLVIFNDEGRSEEEAWLIDRDLRFVPRELMQRARDAVESGQPVRHVAFQRADAPAADVYEVRGDRESMQVDYRNHGIVRITRCRGRTACKLIDRLLAMELATDGLLARTQAQMERERAMRHAAPSK